MGFFYYRTLKFTCDRPTRILVAVSAIQPNFKVINGVNKVTRPEAAKAPDSWRHGPYFLANVPAGI